MNSIDTKVIRGATLRRDPARESCFTVAQLHHEMHDYADMSPVSMRQRLHRHMHNEMQNTEITAQTLADFPDAPWELRMQLARQCWDETRHARLCYRRLRELGGHKGEFPVMNYEWGVVCLMDSLPARMALQNRTFEAGEMDLFRELIGKWKEVGDETTAEMLDGMLADEVQHVRFANQWLKRLARENPRSLMQVARAIQSLQQINQALAPAAGEVNSVGVNMTAFAHLDVFANVEDRRRAGFTEQEIAEILRQEEPGSVAPSSA
jgi:uncharacterized ferritin-like protein (DUF455 family)